MAIVSTHLIDHMNSFHRAIKFTSEYSTTETHFLDVVICKEENSLITDLFVKPTDKHSISDMILQGIEPLANRNLSRENMRIRCVHTIHTHGLNIQEAND